MRISIIILSLLLFIISVIVVLDNVLPSTKIEHSHAAYILNDKDVAKAQSPRIEFIVLHFTDCNFDRSLDTLVHSDSSAHYLVPQEPINNQNIVYYLVPDHIKAAHVGYSAWQTIAPGGQINLNTSSIGMEFVNLGLRKKDGQSQWDAYTDHQIDLAIPLLKDLIAKYNIHPTHILAHGDVTPNIAARGGNTRLDPGPAFPWEKLAAADIGAWYDQTAVDKILQTIPEGKVDISTLQANLIKYGYNVQKTGIMDDQTRNVLRAFQMHFRQSDYSGTPDRETYAILQNLVDKYF